MDCYIYVDGQYVRCELRNADLSDEFDPRKPARILRNQWVEDGSVQYGPTPSRYFYYDALDSEAAEDEQHRQKQYFDRISRLPNTHVTLGEVRRGARRREQKGVDVQMAVDALRAATSGVIGNITLVTGDADFAPLVKAIREAGPLVWIIGFANSLASALEREADRVLLFSSVPDDWTLD